MSKKVLFIVGSLREGSFNHQMALEAEKALAGKAEVSYLDYSAIPLFSQTLKFLHFQLLQRLAKLFKLLMLSGFSLQFTPSQFQEL